MNVFEVEPPISYGFSCFLPPILYGFFCFHPPISYSFLRFHPPISYGFSCFYPPILLYLHVNQNITHYDRTYCNIFGKTFRLINLPFYLVG